MNIILLIELKGIHKSVGKLQLWIIKWQIGTNMVGVLAIPPEGQREEQIAFSAWSVESIHINKSALFYLEDIDSPVLLYPVCRSEQHFASTIMSFSSYM